jgi:Co/Zn/Cd efflux system component
MFLLEVSASFDAGSVSLRADALDFLADALNYVIALSVIGLSLRWRAARRSSRAESWRCSAYG